MKKLPMKKLIPIMVSFILLAGTIIFALASVTAEPSFIFEQNQIANVSISCFDTDSNYCSSSTHCNITIFNPDGSTLVTNQNMSHQISYYNYTLTSDQTSKLGEYSCVVFCDGSEDGYTTFNYEVTPSGNKNLTEGQGTITAVAIIVILIVAGFFIFLATRVERPQMKIIFGSFGGIFILVSVLYSMTILDRTMGLFPNLVEGYATFFLIIKVLTVIAMLALLFYAGYNVLQLWRIKRGKIDEE